MQPGVSRFPATKSRYRIAKNISVRTNITLTASGNSTTILLDKAYFTTEGHRSIIIENLKFSGKEKKTPCIRTYSSRNPTDADLIIRNNYFEGCSFGIYSANWIRNVTVENNHFTDCTYGLYVHYRQLEDH
jgi:polygalacturonase